MSFCAICAQPVTVTLARGRGLSLPNASVLKALLKLEDDSSQLCRGCSTNISTFLSQLKAFFATKTLLEEVFANIVQNLGRQSKTEGRCLKFTLDLLRDFANFDELLASPPSFDASTDQNPEESTSPPPPKIPKKTPSHSCSTCTLSFTSLKSLNAHKRSHTTTTPTSCSTLTCTHCDLIFASLSELKLHRHQTHKLPRDFCPLCQKQLSKGQLQIHLHSHYLKEALSSAPPTPVSCHVCDRPPFKSCLYLSAHMQVHKGLYSCAIPTCRKSFPTAAAKMEHSNHSGCPYCVDSVVEGDAAHVEKHEQDIIKTRFLCDTCGAAFFSKKNLQEHIRLTHFKATSVSSRAHVCALCSRQFATAQRLKMHRLTHQGASSPFNCADCGDKFNQKVSLERHMMVHHDQEKRYKCSQVGCDHPGFTYAQGLRAHVFKKHRGGRGGEDQWVCQVCYKCFQQEDQLKAHAGVHRKLKCELCGKQLKNQTHLKEHTLRHAALRPFQCPHCPSKGFVRQSQLDEHLKKAHRSKDLSGPPVPDSSKERVTYVIRINNPSSGS